MKNKTELVKGQCLHQLAHYTDFTTAVRETNNAFLASTLVRLYADYLQRVKEQAQDTLPSSPPSFEGFMHYLTTLYEI